MRALRTVLGLLLLVVGGALAVVFTTAAPATACSCAAGDQADYFEWSDVVFTGEVLDRGTDDGAISYRFAVDRVYAGDAPHRAVVTSGRQSSACGMPDLRVGTDYVVYATAEDGGRLTTSSCSGTREVRASYVERVEWYAGSGHPPGAVTPDDDPSAAARPRESSGIAERPLALALVGGGAAVVIAGGLLLGRRRIRE